MVPLDIRETTYGAQTDAERNLNAELELAAKRVEEAARVEAALEAKAAAELAALAAEAEALAKAATAAPALSATSIKSNAKPLAFKSRPVSTKPFNWKSRRRSVVMAPSAKTTRALAPLSWANAAARRRAQLSAARLRDDASRRWREDTKCS